MLHRNHSFVWVLCLPTLNLAAAAKPDIEKKSQDAKISVAALKGLCSTSCDS